MLAKKLFVIRIKDKEQLQIRVLWAFLLVKRNIKELNYYYEKLRTTSKKSFLNSY